MLLNRLYGYGPYPRLPILPMQKEAGDKIMGHPDLVKLLELEKTIA